MRARWFVLAALLALFEPNAVRPAAAQPVVPGYEVSTFATVTGPVGLSFDASGRLLVGRDVPGSSGITEQFVQRVPAAGGSGADYGPFGLWDPLGVYVDDTGEFAAEPGSVIVAGPVNGGSGQVVAIRPSQSTPNPTFDVEVLHDAGDVGVVRPSAIVRGPTGGLLIVDSTANAILRFLPPATPTLLIATGQTPRFVAVEGANRIWVTSDTAIRGYDAAGAPAVPAIPGLAGPLPIAVSPGGTFPPASTSSKAAAASSSRSQGARSRRSVTGSRRTSARSSSAPTARSTSLRSPRARSCASRCPSRRRRPPISDPTSAITRRRRRMRPPS